MKKNLLQIMLFLIILIILFLYDYIILILFLLVCLTKVYKDSYNCKKQNNIIIKESNHRIKNNINILVNIIDLKKFVYNDPIIIELIDDLRNKMILISTIHEKIYESYDTKIICIKSYIEDVLKITNNFYNNDVNISFDIEDCLIKPKIAVDIVLIIQEFFNNAIKYAYKDVKIKTFNIYFRKVNSEYLIKISDNGIGFENLNMSQASSFGLKIIQTIVDQYKGKIELSNNNGAKAVIKLIANI